MSWISLTLRCLLYPLHWRWPWMMLKYSIKNNITQSVCFKVFDERGDPRVSLVLAYNQNTRSQKYEYIRSKTPLCSMWRQTKPNLTLLKGYNTRWRRYINKTSPQPPSRQTLGKGYQIKWKTERNIIDPLYL